MNWREAAEHKQGAVGWDWYLWGFKIYKKFALALADILLSLDKDLEPKIEEAWQKIVEEDIKKKNEWYDNE